jgi:hypothetical protein
LQLRGNRDRGGSHPLETGSHFVNLGAGVLVAIEANVEGFFEVLVDALRGRSAVQGKQTIPDGVSSG